MTTQAGTVREPHETGPERLPTEMLRADRLPVRC